MTDILDLGLFSKTGRGLSFEVETPCSNMGTPVRCNVDFENNSTVVKTFGYFSHNTMDPDPDIAGIGASNHLDLMYPNFLKAWCLTLVCLSRSSLQ
jgi:hypothetical protein